MRGSAGEIMPEPKDWDPEKSYQKLIYEISMAIEGERAAGQQVVRSLEKVPDRRGGSNPSPW